MLRIASRRLVSIVLIASGSLGACAVPYGSTGVRAAQGSPSQPVRASLVAVRGTLVGKPLGGGGNGAPRCVDRDTGAAAAAVQQNRGLVICTEEGKLVLLELQSTTRLVDRNGRHIDIAQMALGDRLVARGVLRDGGLLLSPTSVIRDNSRVTSPPPGRSTIAGTLIAGPMPGQSPTAATCGGSVASGAAVQQARGLVICTTRGSLVLIVLSTGTRIESRFGGPATLGLLSIGDHITASGVLSQDGHLLDPAVRVRDTDLQRAGTDSRDFIAQAGISLTLMVLKSDAGGPVRGIVHAFQGGGSLVILCGGRVGTWNDLTRGKTIDITQSIFNRRTMTYMRTGVARVVSCP